MSAQLALVRKDRQLRNSAWRVVQQDIGHVRTDLKLRSVGERVVDRAKDKALLVADVVADTALRHKGMVAAGGAAVILWFGLGPLTRGLRRLFGGKSEPETAAESEYDNEEMDP